MTDETKNLAKSMLKKLKEDGYFLSLMEPHMGKYDEDWTELVIEILEDYLNSDDTE